MKLRNYYTLFPKKFAQKFVFIFCFLLFKQISFSQQSYPLQFVPIPITDTDFIAPGRGAEEWMGMNQVNIPSENNLQKPYDAYLRFEWGQIETGNKIYDFTYFDAACAKAIKNNQHFSFGVMSLCTSCGLKIVDGAKLIYPQYVHDQMQKETAKDWVNSGTWIPNWNSQIYLSAWEDLLKAINNHLQTTTISGVRLSTIINYIDIRGYGNWGEWHSYPYKDLEPIANKPTVSTLLRIINAHKNAFPNIRLVAMTDAFETNNWGSIPAEVGYYLLTAQNAVGQFGWRRDNWGDPASWYLDKLENNNNTFNGVTFKSIIMDKWKFAPIVGEPSSCCTINGGSCQYWELETQIKRYHASSFGNGNLELPSSNCVRTNIRAASKASGYRIIVESGVVNTAGVNGGNLDIELKWKNIGVAPTYENWNVNFILKNASNNIVWSGNSSFAPKTLLPLQISTSIIDKFTLPATLPQGTYQLFLIITDPNNYRKPFPIAIKGRNTDGSYPLTTINIGLNNNKVNQKPIAVAGSDQIISIPQQSVMLDGSKSSDIDGTIIKYLWRQTGGSNLATFSNASNAIVSASKLAEGTYNFQLAVVDNQLDTSFDEVKVNVLGAVLSLQNPDPIASYTTINASQYLLDGTKSSVNNGQIVGYNWKLLSGQSSLIQMPNAPKTLISNLIAGDYIIELTVTDNYGNSAKTLLLFKVAAQNENISTGNMIFPNPTHDILNINLTNRFTGIVKLTIINLEGRILLQKSMQKLNPFLTTTINTSNLPRGMYFLKICIGFSEVVTKKFEKT